jgi:hypothetical protein
MRNILLRIEDVAGEPEGIDVFVATVVLSLSELSCFGNQFVLRIGIDENRFNLQKRIQFRGEKNLYAIFVNG